jgi:RimJ/RimL family protein N-acetyltransferase
VRLRPVTPGDRAALAAGYRELSDRAAYRRFFPVFPELSPAQLRFLTEIDHHGHEAIGAEEPDSGRGVGVARYVRSPTDRAEAEVAVTVADHWQGLGVGTALLEALAIRARAEQVAVFTAEILVDNRAMSALLARLGPVTQQRCDDQRTLVARVELASNHQGRPTP